MQTNLMTFDSFNTIQINNISSRSELRSKLVGLIFGNDIFSICLEKIGTSKCVIKESAFNLSYVHSDITLETVYSYVQTKIDIYITLSSFKLQQSCSEEVSNEYTRQIQQIDLSKRTIAEILYDSNVLSYDAITIESDARVKVGNNMLTIQLFDESCVLSTTDVNLDFNNSDNIKYIQLLSYLSKTIVRQELYDELRLLNLQLRQLNKFRLTNVQIHINDTLTFDIQSFIKNELAVDISYQLSCQSEHHLDILMHIRKLSKRKYVIYVHDNTHDVILHRKTFSKVNDNIVDFLDYAKQVYSAFNIE